MVDQPRGPEKDPTPARVRCKECLKEIPPSEAEQPEAEEYALYFCGLECFQTWLERAEPEITPGKRRRP